MEMEMVMGQVQEDEQLDLPPGFRFHPTDDELVDYFLRHKIDGRDFLVDNDIHVIDIRNFSPWELPGKD